MTVTDVATTVAVTCAVTATVFVLLVPVRHPTLQEATAFLVLTAASYFVSVALPPVLALFFCAWIVKSYPGRAMAEKFTISAPHAAKRDDDAPSGNASPIYHDASMLSAADVRPARDPESMLATPGMLYAAQTADLE